MMTLVEFVLNLAIGLAGFGAGFSLRHLQSVRRRERARKSWQEREHDRPAHGAGPGIARAREGGAR